MVPVSSGKERTCSSLRPGDGLIVSEIPAPRPEGGLLSAIVDRSGEISNGSSIHSSWFLSLFPAPMRSWESSRSFRESRSRMWRSAGMSWPAGSEVCSGF